jgi:hypothetical protein
LNWRHDRHLPENAMTTYHVIIKNWKTGQIVSEYHGASAEELAKIEANHHAHGHPFCDVEATEI